MLTRRRLLLARRCRPRRCCRAGARGRRRTSGRHGHAEGAGRRHGTPGQTPLGPVDTAARWAFITDFNTGATLLDKDGGRADAAVLDDQADDRLYRLRRC